MVIYKVRHGCRAPYDRPVVYIVAFAILVFVGGLAVVFLMARATFRQIKALTRVLADSSDRLAAAAAELEQIAPANRE